MKKKLIAAGLLGATLLTGCTKNIEPEKPKNAEAHTEINYENVDNAEYDAQKLQEDYIKFAFNLYSKCAQNADDSMMVSPASVMFALDMTAAGANEDTLSQIMALYSGDQNVEAQFAFTSDWIKKINSDETVKLTTANSFWMNSSILGNSINTRYVDFIGDKFKSEAYSVEFNQKAEDSMNSWIDKNTNGMIKKVINELSSDAAAVLINTIAFEAKWSTPYEDYQVNEGIFRGTNGDMKVDMLSDTVINYMESDSMIGFKRYYDGADYAFVVMLPKDENIDANKFAASLTGDEYIKFWNSNTNKYDVRTKMPEFKSDYEINLNDTLKQLGVTEAFDMNKANFKGMADLNDTNIYISKVIHKTHIELDRNGTKAAAATVVTMECNSALEDEKEYKEVICDRPYAYAIVDDETGMPLFIGTVNNVEKP